MIMEASKSKISKWTIRMETQGEAGSHEPILMFTGGWGTESRL